MTTTKAIVLMPMLVALALMVNLLFGAIFGAQPANACTVSSGPGGVEGKLQRAEAVFSGVVVRVEEDFSDSPGPEPPRLGTATLDVEESWKGVSAGERVVVGGYGMEASCGIEFRERERYLVYAYATSTRGSEQDEDEVPLNTGLGSGTKLLSKAESDLETLGPGATLTPLPETGGSETGGSETGGDTRDNVANIVVVASGALLFVGTLGAITLWRWRRLTQRGSVGGS